MSMVSISMGIILNYLRRQDLLGAAVDARASSRKKHTGDLSSSTRKSRSGQLLSDPGAPAAIFRGIRTLWEGHLPMSLKFDASKPLGTHVK